MKRYEVTGIPLSPPFSVLSGRAVGEVFEADINKDIEELLVGGGALRVVGRAKAKSEPEPESESESKPEAEPEPEPEPEPAPEPEPEPEPEPPEPEPEPEPEPAAARPARSSGSRRKASPR